MDTPAITDSTFAQPVTLSEVLNLASWERQRSDDELRDFLARRETIIANTPE